MDARLSNGQLIAANNGINAMLQRKIPRAAQLKLLRMSAWLEPYIKPLSVTEQEMRKAYDKDEDNDRFVTEWGELMEQEDDYQNCPQFKASLLDDTNDDLGLFLKWLGKFFKDDVSKDN